MARGPKPQGKPQRAARRPAPPAAARGKATDWGHVADWYDQLVGEAGSEYHQKVIIPGIERMLQRAAGANPAATRGRPLLGMNVFDLACGQGVVARALAERGAAVTAVDAAAELIAAAQRRNAQDKLSITYRVADATKLAVPDGGSRQSPAHFALRTAHYDAVLIVLAIQNMTPLSPIWHACATALKPGGSAIVVMMHPCFRVPKASDWRFDDQQHTQSRTVSQYLSSSRIDIQTHPGLAAHGKSNATTPHFHRPLQAYINTLGGAGLLVDHIEEWPSHKKTGGGPKAAEIDRARREIPMFLAIRARAVAPANGLPAKSSPHPADNQP